MIQHSGNSGQERGSRGNPHALLETRRKGPTFQLTNRSHRGVELDRTAPTPPAECGQSSNWQHREHEAGSLSRKRNVIPGVATASCRLDMRRGSLSARLETPQIRRHHQRPHHLSTRHACTCRYMAAGSWIGVRRPASFSLPGAPNRVACITEYGPVPAGCSPWTPLTDEGFCSFCLCPFAAWMVRSKMALRFGRICVSAPCSTLVRVTRSLSPAQFGSVWA